MKVVFLPGHNGVDAAGCYRCIFPMAYLGDRGHATSMPPIVLETLGGERVRPLPVPGVLNRIPPGVFNVFFLDDFPRDADLYVFHGGTAPFQLEWAERLVGEGRRVVLDLDDDVHRVPSWNPGRQDAASRRRVRRLAELASLVTCATPALAGFYGRFNPNTVVLRNRLHWPMWTELEPVYARREWRRFRVGYMGNMLFHRADLEMVAGPLRKWLVAHPDVEFVAAGDPAIHEVVGTPEGQRVSTSNAFFRNLDLPHIMSCMDVGLVPLVRCDFNECKSNLKGLEYAACGIPSVASPTESYREWVRDGETGMLARHPRDFVEAVDALYRDRDRLRGMGEAAYRLARESSLDRHIDGWEAAYAGVCDHSDAAGTRAAA